MKEIECLQREVERSEDFLDKLLYYYETAHFTSKYPLNLEAIALFFHWVQEEEVDAMNAIRGGHKWPPFSYKDLDYRCPSGKQTELLRKIKEVEDKDESSK